MLYNVPIERLPERYSDQWYKWFEDVFMESFLPFNTIYPTPLSNEIKVGAFLDAIATNHFKAQQLRMICELFYYNRIKNGDCFLFHDGWFPGIEMLAYIRNMTNIDFKLYAIFHAGTYDPWDRTTLVGMEPWGKFVEKGWFELYDKIFVATTYHKNLIYENARIQNPNKIIVTGLPFYPIFVPGVPKENIIVFPHRLDKEKRPQLFDAMAIDLQQEFPDWKFMKTKDHCKTKEEYYKLLDRSKIAVSFAMQETWGIAMQEAVLFGCIPLVPDKLSYPEVITDEFFRFSTVTHAMDKIRDLIGTDLNTHNARQKHFQVKRSILMAGKNAIPNMLFQMGLV